MVRDLLAFLPPLHGSPLEVHFQPDLTNHRGKLESGSGRGLEVQAASFLPQRRVVLDTALLADPHELRRILAHEIFHFVWARLGNPLRWSWEALIVSEALRRAKGELGWSAESCKRALNSHDRRDRTRAWRLYLCESFCDTAASLSLTHDHAEFTLGRRFRDRRRSWFFRNLFPRRLSI